MAGWRWSTKTNAGQSQRFWIIGLVASGMLDDCRGLMALPFAGDTKSGLKLSSLLLTSQANVILLYVL